MKIEKDGIVKNIDDSLANDYVAIGWKIKTDVVKENKKSKLNLDEE